MASAFERFAWMISGGEMPPAADDLVELARDRHQHRPQEDEADDERGAIEPSTARGAARRGSFVSSASVDAVSKP